MSLSPRSSASFRPEVERLEDRALLTSVFVLDFSPDRIPGEQRQAEAFVEAFRGPQARRRRFLDFNRNGRVTVRDAGLGAAKIVERAAVYLRGLDIALVWGDLGGRSRLGVRSLRQGAANGTPTHVIYLGGTSFDGDTATLGEAYQAPAGFNLSHYGFAFTRNIVRLFEVGARFAPPEDFAGEVAQTAVHEFAHLLGLGHPEGTFPGELSIMNHDVDFRQATFPDRPYERVVLYDSVLTRTVGPQNPMEELRLSLAGQPLFSPAGLRYSNRPGEGRRGSHD